MDFAINASDAEVSGTGGSGEAAGSPPHPPQDADQQKGKAVSWHHVSPWPAGPPNSIPWASGRSFDQLMVFVWRRM